MVMMGSSHPIPIPQAPGETTSLPGLASLLQPSDNQVCKIYLVVLTHRVLEVNLFTGPAEHIRAADAADDPAAGGGTGPGQLG